MASLEEALCAVEVGLSSLGAALCERDPLVIEQRARELHVSLARAVERFSGASRQSSVPAELRGRLELASAQIAAQRETVARAKAALVRAIDVLLPRDAESLYGLEGAAGRGPSGLAARA